MLLCRRNVVVVHRLTAAMLRQSVVMQSAVVRRLNVVGGQLNVAMPRLRLNVALAHRLTADRVHRAQRRRHASNNGTIDVWRRHRPNVRRVQRSSVHRENAYRDRFVSNDLRRVPPNGLRRDQRSELSGHDHRRSPADRRRNRTNRRRNRA